MRKRSYIISFTVILLSAIVSLGWGLFHSSTDGCSVANVVDDIRAISSEPHSVAHAKEREAVRDYLRSRLTDLGCEPKVYSYLANEALGFRFDMHNVYAEVSPMCDSAATSLMLVAHYDSRYPWLLRGDTAISLGAADNGYGVGVVLETLRLALERRDEWHQGVKILFTDAEEVGMLGMKAAYAHNRELFDRVGLVINVDARGTYGPALLFETSRGNTKLMDLYARSAAYPFTYSLINIVYRYMPNATDFTIVMDSLPGLNFATVADINHYHTSLDNVGNISLRSIGHYCSQIIPVALDYLTDEAYSDKDALKSDVDDICFAVPLLGLFIFSQAGYIVVNVLFLIALIFYLIYEARAARTAPLPIVASFFMQLLASLLLFGVGLALSWGCATLEGLRYKPMGMLVGVGYDNLAMVLSMIVLVAAMIAAVAWRRRIVAVATMLCATLLLMAVLSTALYIFAGENFILLYPTVVALAGVVLWRLSSYRAFLWIAMAAVTLHAFSFLFVLAMSLTVGALALLLFLAFYYIMLLLLLAMCADGE